MEAKVWNQILNSYCDYIINDGAYYINDERVLRIETAGKSGKKLYTRYTYIDDKGYNFPCMGLSGATGHGWGGHVEGYLTKKQIEDLNIKIVRMLF